MSGEVSKQDQALVRGAQLVTDAKGELEGQLSGLRGKLSSIGSQWVGAGSAAFQQVMTRWDEDTRRILTALSEFEANLRSSESTYNTTDESQSSTFNQFTSRLG